MKQIFALLLAVCLLPVCLMGCGGEPDEPELNYSDLVEPALDVSPEILLPEAELTAIMGEDSAMVLMGVYEDGTQAVYRSDTGAGTVRLHVQAVPRGDYDAMLAGLPGSKEPLEDVGESACWYDSLEVFAYQQGYMLEVIVTVPGQYVPQRESVAVARLALDNLKKTLG